MAIDGAAVILEREFDRLSPDDREMLAGVVGSGTARLRRLLAQDAGGATPVSMADTAAQIAHDPAWPTPLKLDVTADLLAVGSAAERRRRYAKLVDYASQRSREGPVTLRGDRDGRWGVLRVEDENPTMPRELRRTLTDPEARREPGRGGRHERAGGGQVDARAGWAATCDREPSRWRYLLGICLPAITAGHEAQGVDA